jgi:hypothetical protein
MALHHNGAPCKFGHTLRYEGTGDCVRCHTDAGRRHRLKYPGRHREYVRRRRNFPAPTRPEPLLCELCDLPSNKALCLDHDHKTNKFRGWLCAPCNLGIGKLGDDVSGLERALDYLRRNGSS